MPLAMAKSVIGTFSTTLVRADGVSRPASSMPGSADVRISATGTPISVAYAAGSRTRAETSQTGTTTATTASTIRCAALSAAAGS